MRAKREGEGSGATYVAKAGIGTGLGAGAGGSQGEGEGRVADLVFSSCATCSGSAVGSPQNWAQVAAVSPEPRCLKKAVTLSDYRQMEQKVQAMEEETRLAQARQEKELAVLQQQLEDERRAVEQGQELVRRFRVRVEEAAAVAEGAAQAIQAAELVAKEAPVVAVTGFIDTFPEQIKAKLWGKFGITGDPTREKKMMMVEQFVKALGDRKRRWQQEGVT